MTREKVEGLVKDLEAEGALDPEEGRKLVEEVLSKGEERARDLSRQVRAEVKKALDEMDIEVKDKMKQGCNCKDGECDCDDDCDCQDCGCECAEKDEKETD